MIDIDAIEEADIEICASAFDNLLLEVGQSELREYQRMLVLVGAKKCAAVVEELLNWIDGVEGGRADALGVVYQERERYFGLWKKYDAASVDEDPQKLAKNLL